MKELTQKMAEKMAEIDKKHKALKRKYRNEIITRFGKEFMKEYKIKGHSVYSLPEFKKHFKVIHKN